MKIRLPKIKIDRRLKSRKLWLSLVAAVFPILNQTFEWGFDEQVVMKVFAGLLAFVFSEAVVDSARALSNNQK